MWITRPFVDNYVDNSKKTIYFSFSIKGEKMVKIDYFPSKKW